jgi:hypothetical protein
MICEVELANGYGDHVTILVKAESEEAARAMALERHRTLGNRFEHDCAGSDPEVRVTVLGGEEDGVLKVSAFNHECGTFY